MSSKKRNQLDNLKSLVPLLHQRDGFTEVLTELESGNGASIDGAWGSSCALSVAGLAAVSKQSLLVVLPRMSEVDEFAVDVLEFTGTAPTIFPAWESLPSEHEVSDAIFGGRLRVLREMESGQPPGIVITSISALLQPVPSAEERKSATRNLTIGDEVEIDELLSWLVARGFEHVPAVEVPGEFSMHGGILDLYPPDEKHPIRIEFFGDEIDSIRNFHVETQRKIESLQEICLTVVVPVGSGENADSGILNSHNVSTAADHFLDVIPDKNWIILSEIQTLTNEGKHYLELLENPKGLYSVSETLARCTTHPHVILAAIVADGYPTRCHLGMESVERFTGKRKEVMQELTAIISEDEQLLIACHNAGEQERLQELLVETDDSHSERVKLCVGQLTHGFRMAQEKVVVISDHELFGRSEIRREVSKKPSKLEARAIDNFLELRTGELVVHLTHGIGRFRGMELLEKDNQKEEHLIIEFRDQVRIFVPASLIHLVQKYIGAAKSTPQLSKVGTTRWSKQKERVEKAVQDMASEMIRMQAMRDARPGLTSPPDSHWQEEFEASFPYNATADQVSAISDVKADMRRPRPMDRLICGDVGYGKTEVAMRAAFKAIDAGRQVAVLVPTTVLAEQHFRTFSERMAEYPITIEGLSRFRTKSEQREILKQMKAGSLDLVIGTHRLVQKDVQFKNLGLLIIDEEQRFGVEAKELLKRLRLEVDVLTMSATPIPRTLHLSLLGIRDISNLTTPPHERQPIQTRISRFDPELIRSAIVRELNRNGQIFFVHNRVYNIQSIADKIRTLVPEANIGVVHGQMPEGELERAMYEFVTRQTDILVATTIIESGLDIPAANTIFIHQADMYGLADLHQLRGRVGRYKHRAYCYLLLEEGRTVTSAGAKRLKAIEEFSELGAGFKIAMRDLEIRGAGNILGTEQSGHISSVGYELYCQLLENSVRQMKKMPLRQLPHVAVDLPLTAYLPDNFIPPGKQKVEIYRKLSQVKSQKDLEQFADELRDRFGNLPDEVHLLLELKILQLLALNWQIDDIHLEEGYAVFGYRHVGKVKQLAAKWGSKFRIVDDKSVYWVLTSKINEPSKILAELKSVLQPIT